MRRAVLLAGLIFVACPGGSALAAMTVGQTGTPLSNSGFGHGYENAQTGTAVPTAGVVTSFQTQSINSCSADPGGVYDFQVLRPLGGNQYRVLGDTGNKTDPCDGQLHSYPVDIPVQAGDVIAVYIVRDWAGVLSFALGSMMNNQVSQPAIGDNVALPYPTTGTPDESATLVSEPPTAQISSPADNQTFALNQAVQTTFSCTEASGGPGIQVCADSNGTSGRTGTFHGTLDTSTAGAHAYRVTATSQDGLSGSATITYTVVGQPTQPTLSQPKPTQPKPAISALKLRPRSFRASRATTLKLTLSAAATVHAVIYRSGHKLRGKCRATAKTGKKCTIKLKTLTFRGVSGDNHFKIKTKGLKPGSYTLVVAAGNSTGTSGKHKLTFRIQAFSANSRRA